MLSISVASRLQKALTGWCKLRSILRIRTLGRSKLQGQVGSWRAQGLDLANDRSRSRRGIHSRIFLSQTSERSQNSPTMPDDLDVGVGINTHNSTRARSESHRPHASENLAYCDTPGVLKKSRLVTGLLISPPSAAFVCVPPSVIMSAAAGRRQTATRRSRSSSKRCQSVDHVTGSYVEHTAYNWPSAIGPGWWQSWV